MDFEDAYIISTRNILFCFIFYFQLFSHDKLHFNVAQTLASASTNYVKNYE